MSHTLHIKIDGKLLLPGGSHLPEIDSPVINVPISDAIGTMLELGLEAIPDRAADGNPEIIAHGSARVPVFKIFGRQINIDENYEIDAEFWITSTDDIAQAQATAIAANKLENAPKQYPSTAVIPPSAPVEDAAPEGSTVTETVNLTGPQSGTVGTSEAEAVDGNEKETGVNEPEAEDTEADDKDKEEQDKPE